MTTAATVQQVAVTVGTGMSTQTHVRGQTHLAGQVLLYLSTATVIGATQLVFVDAPNCLGNTNGWVIVDPYTANVEYAQVTLACSTTWTITPALAKAHSINCPVLWVDRVVQTSTVTWAGATVANGAYQEVSLAFTGALLGDVIGVSLNPALPSGCWHSAPEVSSAGNIRFTIYNGSGSQQVLPSTTVKILGTRW